MLDKNDCTKLRHIEYSTRHSSVHAYVYTQTQPSAAAAAQLGKQAHKCLLPPQQAF